MKFLSSKTRLPAVHKEDVPTMHVDATWPFNVANPFFSFTYSHHVMQSTPDGKTRVMSKTIQCENGRIESESYEGYLPTAVFENTLRESQRLFADQVTWLLKQFSSLLSLPTMRKQDRRDE
jgi:hypothetical protein